MTTLIEAYYRRLRSFDREEFYSPTQLRDKDGQWTKMWSGVSARPGHRTVPKATGEVYPYDIFETDLGDGYSSHVADYYTIGETGHQVNGIIMKDGKSVGVFSRFINDSPDARVVIHENLEIDAEHRAFGLADRFNTHAVAQYQKMGVDHIELSAALEVGGYAWARQGYRLHPESNKPFLNKQLDRIESQLNKPVLREHADKVRAEVSALRKAIEAGEDVQPIHIASIGEQYGRYKDKGDDGREYETWPGKSVLLGTTWTGYYYFDAANSVTAAATSLKHAELRPAFRRERPGIVSYVADRLGIEEFYSPTQLRDKEGQWTRYGKGFGGPSAHPDHRTKPRPQLDEGDFTDARIGEVARKLWGDGARIGIIAKDHRSLYAEVSGEITNKHGDVLGWYERKIRLAADGTLSVEHTALTIDDVYQGRSIGSEWNATAIAGYRELGVDHVDVHAADEVGGYAWAREGFRTQGTGQIIELIGSASTQLEHAAEWGRITPEHHTEAVRQFDALYAAARAGEDVQPIHIASIGENTMRYKRETTQGDTIETWPGKDALLGTMWFGVYYFDANSAVTAAAALVEFYDQNQPRDKDGQWTRYRSGITSLSRDTLDRALNRGISGIFSEGNATGIAPWPRAPRLKGQQLYDKALVDTELRKNPTLEKVDPRTLFATQPGLARQHVEYYLSEEYKRSGKPSADVENIDNEYPVVYVNKKGQHIILVGHHRAAAALLKGEELDARVIREQ